MSNLSSLVPRDEEEYGCSLFTVKMRHGGRIEGDKYKSYVGAEVRRTRPDAPRTKIGQKDPRPAASTDNTQKRVVQKKRKLTDAEKGAINANYAYLGKKPPFKVGNWAGRSFGRGRAT